MNSFIRILCLLLVLISFGNRSISQIEHTYTWFPQDHSAWKVQPNSPTGYVIIGNKFFEPANTSLYVQGFDETGTSLFLKTYPSGLTIQTFWKSFTVVNTNPVRFFAVVGASGNKTYGLLVDANGNKIWDRIQDLPGTGTQLGGVTNANGGGWVACGSDGFGNLLVIKFNSTGFIEWTKTYPISGFGWSIAPVTGGGYVIGSTSNKVTKINNSGNLVWSTSFSLPPSPAPDGSNYTYTEFEEVFELPNGDGFICTGSAFSNQTSAVYTARVSTTGTLVWTTIHNPVNTGLPGTPVSWVSNAFSDLPNSVVTSWRNGPVSIGGAMFYQRQYINTGNLANGVTNLGNTTRVQEAFILYAHNKYVVGGTAGSYIGAYSYIKDQLPVPGRVRSNQTNYSVPAAESNPLNRRIQINRYNYKPEFEYPVASRVFNSKMRVFPNPSTGIINVGGKIEPGAMLRVTDLMGRIVLEKQIMPGEDLIELDLTGQGKGMYTVEMLSGNQLVTKKIVLK